MLTKRAILAICCAGLGLGVWYGFSLTDKDLPDKMSDSSLKAAFAANREDLLEFASRFMMEEGISDIALVSDRQIALNSYSLQLDERDIANTDLNINPESLRFYVEVLRNTGFFRATVRRTLSGQHKYLEFAGDGSFEVGYGLLYSPEGIAPSELSRAIFHSAKIENNWYTFRDK